MGVFVLNKIFFRKGLVSFGTIDDRNIFHLLPRIDGRFVDWNFIRSLDISTTTSETKTFSQMSNKTNEEVVLKSNDGKSYFDGKMLKETNEEMNLYQNSTIELR